MNPQAKYAPSKSLQSLPLRYSTSRKIRFARAFFPLLDLLSFGMAQTTPPVPISCQTNAYLVLMYIYHRLLYGATCITKETVSQIPAHNYCHALSDFQPDLEVVNANTIYPTTDIIFNIIKNPKGFIYPDSRRYSMLSYRVDSIQNHGYSSCKCG